VFSADIQKPSAGLIARSFINNMEDWLPGDVEDINNNRTVEVHVVAKVESESTRRLPMALAVYTVSGEVLKCLLVDIVACPFQYTVVSVISAILLVARGPSGDGRSSMFVRWSGSKFEEI
jgi:hypothetical protein